ncbi:MAG: MlaD family protein [Alphaproteobacteria bacterium]|nr:MlaD family protein [Alphaproteobacteria bacterium]
MVKQRWFEILLGGAVFGIAIFFLVWANANTNGSKEGTVQRIVADFTSIKGLRVGNDVRIGGVKIGSVEKLAINPDTFQAQVTMAIRNDVLLPTDTAVAIISDGLLGGAYMRVNPGSDAQKIADGGKFTIIEQSATLEELLGKAVFIISETSSE